MRKCLNLELEWMKNQDTKKKKKKKSLIAHAKHMWWGYLFILWQHNHRTCRVTNCSPNPDGIGYGLNEPNTINLWEWVKELGWWWVL